jgi:hypothetical protein
MSKTYIPVALRRAVTERAKHRCSYCLTSSEIIGSPFTIDHIMPESLGGPTTYENLCLSCWSCNMIKQARIAGPDPQSGQVERLFDPYKQKWDEHLTWQKGGLLIAGLTSTGRATVDALKLNRAPLVNARLLLSSDGLHPPG